jgi:phage-related minor tail protein
MARKRISGITIEIEGDVQPLQKALKNVDNASAHTSSELDKINRALKFDEGNSTLLAQKQEVLQEAIKNTTTRLDGLKQAQQEVDKLYSNGEIDASTYRTFQREIESTEGKLESYQDQVKAMESAQSRLGDSTKQLNRLFELTGTTIDDFADSLDAKLVRAIRDGRASTQQLERAFEEVGRTALGTNTDLEKLRTTLQTLDSGANLEQVRKDLQAIEQEAESANKSVSGLSKGLGLLGGIGAGIGIGKAVDNALAQSDVDAVIDITFDVPESSKKSIREALIDVQKYGIDSQQALEGVRRQWALNKDASDSANRKIVESAGAITKAYDGIDFVQLIQETNEIAGELKTTDEEALNLVNTLFKIGFPVEEIDIIAEYGGQLQRAGYEAKEIASIMATATSQNGWNIDSLLDGLKEGRIRAAEFGNGLSEGMKDNLRKVTGIIEAASEEELEIMRDGFDKKETALSKSLANQEKALTKSHDAQQRQLEKSLDAEMRAFEKSSERKLKLLDEEYMAKLKIIDEEKYNKIKAIDDEIASLQALTDAENKQAQAEEDAQKRAELEENVGRARTNYDRKKAQEELAKFEAQLTMKALQEQRKEKVEALKDEKNDVKDIYDEKKDALKSEFDLKKEQLREINNAERDALRERHQDQKDALRERLNDEMEAVREAHASELESYRKMNAQKLKEASTPRDTAQFKGLESQLESWGKAISSGGEQGTKAFEEMVTWLNGIEDATLQNIIGIELFGTRWEDEGQKIIDTLLNSKDSMDEFNKATNEADAAVKKLNDGSATVNLQNAFGKLLEALRPVLDIFAFIIDKVASLMIAFPGLTALIVTLVTAVGGLAGAFGILKPIVSTISSMFGGGGDDGKGGGKAGGLFKSLGKVIPLFTKFATKVLPWVARGFLGLSGPIGWIMLAIELLIKIVPKLIKNWTKIGPFFGKLWKGIKSVFKGGFKVIEDVSKALVGVVKTPTNELIKLLNTFIKGVNKMKIPDWVPYAGGKNFAIPEIPMLARGTNYFKGGVALVGEQGPELVTLPTASKVHTAKQTAAMLGGGEEITINVPLHIDGRLVANAIAKHTNRNLYEMKQRDVRGR